MKKKPDYKDYDHICTYLRDMRGYLKEREPEFYTQKLVSEFCGLDSSQYISNIERKLAAPSYEVAAKIAVYYKIERRALYELFLKMKEKELAEKFLDKGCKQR